MNKYLRDIIDKHANCEYIHRSFDKNIVSDKETQSSKISKLNNILDDLMEYLDIHYPQTNIGLSKFFEGKGITSIDQLEIFVKNLSNKKILLDMFYDNKGKSLILSDKFGVWIISSDYSQLKRISNTNYLNSVTSYWSFFIGDDIQYFMENGHKFILSYDNEKFGIGETKEYSIFYKEHNWI